MAETDELTSLLLQDLSSLLSNYEQALSTVLTLEA